MTVIGAHCLQTILIKEERIRKRTKDVHNAINSSFPDFEKTMVTTISVFSWEDYVTFEDLCY